MAKRENYFKIPLRSLASALDWSIKFIGAVSIVVGCAILRELIFEPSKRTIPMSVETAIWTYGAALLVFFFIFTWIAYTVKYFKKRDVKSNKDTDENIAIPTMEIKIILDFTKMTPKQIAVFMKELKDMSSAQIETLLRKTKQETCQNEKGRGKKSSQI